MIKWTNNNNFWCDERVHVFLTETAIPLNTGKFRWCAKLTLLYARLISRKKRRCTTDAWKKAWIYRLATCLCSWDGSLGSSAGDKYVHATLTSREFRDARSRKKCAIIRYEARSVTFNSGPWHQNIIILDKYRSHYGPSAAKTSGMFRELLLDKFVCLFQLNYFPRSGGKFIVSEEFWTDEELELPKTFLIKKIVEKFQRAEIIHSGNSLLVQLNLRWEQITLKYVLRCRIVIRFEMSLEMSK